MLSNSFRWWHSASWFTVCIDMNFSCLQEARADTVCKGDEGLLSVSTTVWTLIFVWQIICRGCTLFVVPYHCSGWNGVSAWAAKPAAWARLAIDTAETADYIVCIIYTFTITVRFTPNYYSVDASSDEGERAWWYKRWHYNKWCGFLRTPVRTSHTHTHTHTQHTHHTRTCMHVVCAALLPTTHLNCVHL